MFFIILSHPEVTLHMKNFVEYSWYLRSMYISVHDQKGLAGCKSSWIFLGNNPQTLLQGSCRKQTHIFFFLHSFIRIHSFYVTPLCWNILWRSVMQACISKHIKLGRVENTTSCNKINSRQGIAPGLGLNLTSCILYMNWLGIFDSSKDSSKLQSRKDNYQYLPWIQSFSGSSIDGTAFGRRIFRTESECCEMSTTKPFNLFGDHASSNSTPSIFGGWPQKLVHFFRIVATLGNRWYGMPSPFFFVLLHVSLLHVGISVC